MFETILVAHRGPLAVRVVRTVQRVGAKAVTVHSDVDDRALHVTTADESVLLGPTAAYNRAPMATPTPRPGRHAFVVRGGDTNLPALSAALERTS